MTEHIHDRETCKKYLALLSDYVDDDLQQDMCASLEEHMADCENCMIVVNTLKKTIDLYHTVDEDENPTLPDDVRSRLVKRLSLEDLLK
jgi:predicted anti-sigma-YlaC factor YlaD